MRFSTTHRFTADLPAVEAAMTDASFYQSLRLPDIGENKVLDRWVDGHATVLRVRFVFAGHLDPLARNLLGDKEIAWIQEIRLDTQLHGGTLDVSAESHPERMKATAAITLDSDGADTVRHLEGELRIRVPVVGGLAERRVGSGLLRRLDLEAVALDEWLHSSA